MADKKEKNLEYRVFSMRLQEETREWLKLKHSQKNVSWNKFIIILLNGYEKDKNSKN